jgi:undecaprenyl-diphosphatase
MDIFLILCAKYLFLVLLLIAGFVFLKSNAQTRRNMMFLGLISFPLILVAAWIAGHLFYDPRPFVIGHFTPLIAHDPDNGFPSDHTLLSTAVSFLILRFDRKAGWILLALSLLVGMARIYVGIHHFTDIAGSFVISGLGVFAAKIFLDSRGKNGFYGRQRRLRR